MDNAVDSTKLDLPATLQAGIEQLSTTSAWAHSHCDWQEIDSSKGEWCEAHDLVQSAQREAMQHLMRAQHSLAFAQCLQEVCSALHDLRLTIAEPHTVGWTARAWNAWQNYLRDLVRTVAKLFSLVDTGAPQFMDETQLSSGMNGVTGRLRALLDLPELKECEALNLDGVRRARALEGSVGRRPADVELLLDKLRQLRRNEPEAQFRTVLKSVLEGIERVFQGVVSNELTATVQLPGWWEEVDTFDFSLDLDHDPFARSAEERLESMPLWQRQAYRGY